LPWIFNFQPSTETIPHWDNLAHPAEFPAFFVKFWKAVPRPTTSTLRTDSALHQLGYRQVRGVSLRQRRQVDFGVVKAFLIEAAKGARPVHSKGVATQSSPEE